MICLESEITREFIEAVAATDPEGLSVLIHAFKGNDQLKANAMHGGFHLEDPEEIKMYSELI